MREPFHRMSPLTTGRWSIPLYRIPTGLFDAASGSVVTFHSRSYQDAGFGDRNRMRVAVLLLLLSTIAYADTPKDTARKFIQSQLDAMTMATRPR